jgi:hypothetical protein
MKTIVLRNNTANPLRIMIEPWVERYDIAAGSQVELLCDLKDGEIDFEINFEEDNFLGIWAPDGTKVLLDGVVMKKLSDT